eukprot:scaffold37189_cov31-Tisochrysis_lutea.AAC.1
MVTRDGLARPPKDEVLVCDGGDVICGHLELVAPPDYVVDVRLREGEPHGVSGWPARRKASRAAHQDGGGSRAADCGRVPAEIPRRVAASCRTVGGCTWACPQMPRRAALGRCS